MNNKFIWLPLSCLVILCLLLSSCGVFGGGTPETVITGDDLAAVLAQAPNLNNLSMKYDEVITVVHEGTNINMTYKCWIKGMKAKRETTFSDGTVSVYISDYDAKTAYSYNTKQNTATKYNLRSTFNPEYNLANTLYTYRQILESNPEYKYTGDEYIDRYLCYIYELGENKYWVRSDNGLVIAFEDRIQNYKQAISNIEFNIDIPDSMFELPAGVTVTEK